MSGNEMTILPDMIRNVGVMAHVDAGKTTLTERVLFNTGAVSIMGEVDDGTAVTDFMAEEQLRGISIVAASTWCTWRGRAISLIDTPGHVDFTVEVERTLRVVDGAVVVISSVEGVQAQTEAVWRQADAYSLPRLCFVNKMDRPGADLGHVIEQIRARLHPRAVAVQLPVDLGLRGIGVVDLVGLVVHVWDGRPGVGSSLPIDVLSQVAREQCAAGRAALIDAMADVDDAVVEAFVEGGDVNSATLLGALRAATSRGDVVPVMCGSASKNFGVDLLLDGIVDYLPYPFESSASDVKEQALGPDAPLRSFVFKVQDHHDVGRLAFIRLYSGSLRAGDAVHFAQSKRTDRVGAVGRVTGADWEPIGCAGAGEIVAVAGLLWQRSGETIGSRFDVEPLEAFVTAAPVMAAPLEAATDADAAVLREGLSLLIADDPTMRLSLEEDTGRMVLEGMGELHLAVAVAQVARTTGADVRIGRPTVRLREAIGLPASARESIKRVVAGRGESATVAVSIEAATPGMGIQVDVSAVASVLDSGLLSSLRAGVADAAYRGSIAGLPLLDVNVKVTECLTHAVDVSHLVVRDVAAASMAVAMRNAEPFVVEPVMRVEICVPMEYVGAVLNDLAARRGSVSSIETHPRWQAVDAMLPLAEMFDYSSDLRSLSHGRAAFSMHFERYSRVPATFRMDSVARTAKH
jgi:elongation factor G